MMAGRLEIQCLFIILLLTFNVRLPRNDGVTETVHYQVHNHHNKDLDVSLGSLPEEPNVKTEIIVNDIDFLNSSDETAKTVHHQVHYHQGMTVHFFVSSNEDLDVLLGSLQEEYLKTEIVLDFPSSSGDHHVWETSQNTPLAVTSAPHSTQWEPHVEGFVFPEKVIGPANMISIAIPSPRNTVNVKCHILKTFLELLNSIPFQEDQNYTEIPCSHLSHNGVQHPLVSGWFTLQARIQLVPTPPIGLPISCRQSRRGVDPVRMKPTTEFLLFPMPVHMFIQFLFTFMLHSSHPPSPACPGLTHPSKELTSIAIGDAQSTPRLNSAEPVEESLEIPQTITDRHCLDCPFWSRLFKFFNSCDKFSREDCHIEHTDVNSIALDPIVREILFLLMILMTVLFRYLPQIEADKGSTGDIFTYLNILSQAFFLKWKWNQENDDSSDEELLKNLKAYTKKWNQENQHTLWWPASPMKALDDYIRRPWLTKSQPTDCCSSASRLCCSCQRNFDNFLANNHRLLEVSPAFLPNPTRIPTLDLAHVGYRLATLSALPSSFPVSRVRLADAGFYFQGHEDEVTCYSCQARYSRWRAEDNPMQIHRQLSPQCRHVMQTSRDITGVASQAPSTTTTTPNLPENSHPPVVNGPQNGHAPENAHISQTGHVPADGHAAQNSHVYENAHDSETHPAARNQDPAEDGEPLRTHPPRPTSASAPSTNSSQQPHRGGLVPPVNPAAVSPGDRAETRAQNGSSPRNKHVSSGNAARMEPASISGGPSEDSSSTERNHTGTATSDTSRNEPGIETSRNRTTSSNENAHRAVSPSGVISGHQNEAAATACGDHYRHLFPRARLDLGGAVYPMYQDMRSRRRTFSSWDDTRAPPLDDVILSGMFYAGYADCVRCFYCGVGLKNWVVTDNVWDEHVRWRPGCGYFRTIKGDHFITETQRRLGIEVPTSANSQGHDRVPYPANRNDNSTSPAEAQGQQPTSSPSASPSSSSSSTTITSATTTTTTTNSASTGQASSEAAAATASTAVTTATTNSQPVSNRSADPSSEGGQREGGGGGGGDARVVAADESRDQQALSRLQAENRTLNQRFRCRLCHQSAIDIIFMPCGHLVVCENCAGTVMSCPLCHVRIGATAKVYF